MDELLEEEEKVQKEYDQKLKVFRDFQFRKIQELYECKVKERNIEVEIQVSIIQSYCKYVTFDIFKFYLYIMVCD